MDRPLKTKVCLETFLNSLNIVVGPLGVETVVCPDASFMSRRAIKSKSYPEGTVEAKCQTWLQQYLLKNPSPFNVENFSPIDGLYSDFRLSVWRVVSQIPFGDVLSYGDIARAVGQPLASRAVGTAVGQNPCFIFRPCHRVITSGGKLGGFAFNLDIKRALLAHEGVVLR